MIAKLIISNVCISCDSCRAICPETSIFTQANKYFIDDWSCTRCSLCIQVCPVTAIKIEEPKPEPDL